MPFYLFNSMQRMIKGAQTNPTRLGKLIFHHGLIKLIVLEQLQKEGKDWKTFLFVSNFQIELPTILSPIKKVKKQETSSPIVVVKKEPSSSIAPKAEGSSPTQNLKKLKGKAKQGHEEEDLEEKSVELPLEPPQEVHMEVQLPTLRRSTRRKLMMEPILEEPMQKEKGKKQDAKLSRKSASPLEKEVIEVISKIKESPSLEKGGNTSSSVDQAYADA